jgi:hypothetical protein
MPLARESESAHRLAAALWTVVAGMANAWVLIVEVARDARYLPLDDHEADRSPATARHTDDSR